MTYSLYILHENMSIAFNDVGGEKCGYGRTYQWEKGWFYEKSWNYDNSFTDSRTSWMRKCSGWKQQATGTEI